jgi:hypothetical protein
MSYASRKFRGRIKIGFLKYNNSLLFGFQGIVRVILASAGIALFCLVYDELVNN